MEVRSEREYEDHSQLTENHLHRDNELALQYQMHNSSHDILLPSFPFSELPTPSGNTYTNNDNLANCSEEQRSCLENKLCDDVNYANAQLKESSERFKSLECHEEENEYKHTEEQWERQILPLSNDRQTVNGIFEQQQHHTLSKQLTNHSNVFDNNLQWNKSKSLTRNSDNSSYSKSKHAKKRSSHAKRKHYMPELEYELLLQTSFPSAYTSGYVIEEEEMSDGDDDNHDDGNTSKWVRSKSNTRNRTKEKEPRKHRLDNDSIEYSFEFQEDESDSEGDSSKAICKKTHVAKRSGKTVRHGKESHKLNNNKSHISTSSYAASMSSSSTYSSLQKSTTSSRRKAKRKSASSEQFPNKKKQEIKHSSKDDMMHIFTSDNVITNKKIRKKLERQHHSYYDGHSENVNDVIKCTNTDDLHLTSREVQELFASQHHRERKAKYNNNQHEINEVSCEERNTWHKGSSDYNAHSHYNNSSRSKLEDYKHESTNNFENYTSNKKIINNKTTDNSRSDELAQFFISPIHQCVAQASSPWSTTQFNNDIESSRYQFIGYGGLPGLASTAQSLTEEPTSETLRRETSVGDKMSSIYKYNMHPEHHCDHIHSVEERKYQNDLYSSVSDARREITTTATATTLSPDNVDKKTKDKKSLLNHKMDSVHEHNRERKKWCKDHRDYGDIIGEIEISWEGNSWSSGTDSFELPSNKNRKARKRRRMNECVGVEDYLEMPHPRQCVRKDKLVNAECGGSKVLAPHPAPPMLLPHTSLPCSTLTLHEEIIPVSLELTSLSLGDTNGADDVHFIFET